MTAPRNLDELRAIADPAERARAVAGYLERAEHAIAGARRVRHDAIAELIAADPDRGSRPSVIAKAVGVSVSTVKAIRDGRIETAFGEGSEQAAQRP